MPLNSGGVLVTINADDKTRAAFESASQNAQRFSSQSRSSFGELTRNSEEAGKGIQRGIGSGLSNARLQLGLIDNTIRGAHAQAMADLVHRFANTALVMQGLPIASTVAGFVLVGGIVYELGQKLYDMSQSGQRAFEKIREESDKTFASLTKLQTAARLELLSPSDRTRSEIKVLQSELSIAEKNARNAQTEIARLLSTEAKTVTQTKLGPITTVTKPFGPESPEVKSQEEILRLQLHVIDVRNDQIKAKEKELTKAIADEEDARLRHTKSALESMRDLEDPMLQFYRDLTEERRKYEKAEEAFRESLVKVNEEGGALRLQNEFLAQQLKGIGTEEVLPLGLRIPSLQQVQEFSKGQKLMLDINQSLSESFSSMFQDIALGTRGISQAFESMAASVAASLMQMAGRMIFVATIEKLITSLAGLTTVGSFGPNSQIPLFGGIPGHAGGGDVLAGAPIWVGEQGPEIFVPRTSGSILPNGAGLTVHNEVKVINNSSRQVDAKVTQTKIDARHIVTAVFLTDFQQNGPIRQALSNRG